MALTRAQMEALINAGQGVSVNGRIVTNVADLPTQAEIDEYPFRGETDPVASTALPLTAPWVDAGGAYDVARYYRDRDRVYLSGVVGGGTLGSVIATLPAGYRPAATLRFTVPTNYDVGPGGLAVATVGVAGATAYSYRVSAVMPGGETVASAAVAIATGNAALSGANFNRLTWTAVAGAIAYKVYGRTAGTELYLATVQLPTYDDTGVAAPAGALPTGDALGVVEVAASGAITLLQGGTASVSLAGIEFRA